MSASEPLKSEEAAVSPIRALFAGHVAEGLIFPYPEISADEKETVSAFLQSFRDFARDHIDAAKIDREHQIAPEVVRGLADLGVFGMTIPEAYGGYGFSASAYCRVTEEIARTDASIGILIGGHQSIGSEGADSLRHRRAEEEVAAAPGDGGDDRGVRADGVGGGLGRRFHSHDGRLRRRRPTPSSSTAASTGSPTAASRNSSRCSPRTRTLDVEGRAPQDHRVRRDQGSGRSRSGQGGDTSWA